jgi:predicted MFS family arabinose efflux permease
MITRPGVVAIALLAGILAAGHVGKLPPALPSIRAEIGLDIATAGWLASTFSATGALIAIFLGAAADRVNHWRLAIAGLGLMSISGAVGSLASAAAPLIFSRFCEGIGFLAVVVAAPSIIAQSSSGRTRSMSLGLWPGYMPAGVSILILAAPLALQAGGWRGLWVALSLLTLVAAIAMWAFQESASCDRTGREKTTVWQNVRAGASRADPWLVASCFALYGAQLYAIMTWMPTFMIEERGIGAGAAAGLTGLVVVANGVCNVLGGYLLRYGAAPRAMIMVSGGIMLLSAAGAFTASLSDILRYTCSMALCGAGGVVASATFAIAPSLAPSPAQIGTINGILVQASNVAQFVGPAALATVVAVSGHWEGAFWPMVGANVLLILLVLLMRRQSST